MRHMHVEPDSLSMSTRRRTCVGGIKRQVIIALAARLSVDACCVAARPVGGALVDEGAEESFERGVGPGRGVDARREVPTVHE